MRVVVAFLLLCGCARTADSPPQGLFDKARARVLANIARVPRYTCVETIVRTQHHPQYGSRPSTCSGLIAARARISSEGLLLWHDRLRVDVAVGAGSEMFSWAGASKFETNEMDKLALNGSTGTGAFSSFLAGVFGGEPDHFEYSGVENGLAVFNYRVPQPRSHYSYRASNGVDHVIAYRGSFYVVPASAELKRLIVEATEFPAGDACRVENKLDYSTVKIGAGEFMLPELSTMTVLYDNGDESRNETRFSGCHEYVGESTIRFDDESDPAPASVAAKAALKDLPPKTKVRVHLEKPIDSDRAAAGDPVTAVVDRDTKVVRKGDKLHGRILRLEQHMVPFPRWIVAIRFESIERDGVDQAVRFLPLDDGDRSPAQGIAQRTLRSAPLPKEPAGAGMFSFAEAGKLILDEKFRSEWEVAK